MGVIGLTGTLRCAPDEADTLRAALPRHLRLTLAEQGRMAFHVTGTAPGVFSVSERFDHRAVFEVRQVRSRASDWWQATRQLTRDFRLAET